MLIIISFDCFFSLSVIFLDIDKSISSENLSIRSKALDNDVPPLKTNGNLQKESLYKNID